MWSRSRLIFIALSLTTMLLVASGRMLAENNRQTDDGKDSMYKYLAVFTETLSLVKRAYVDELDDESLMAGAFEGTLDALDPFSLYVPADRAERFRSIREVGMSRSGLLILKERGVAYVAAAEEGSPGQLAGIERGHILSVIQGERTRIMPLDEILAILAGEPGTEVEVERIHRGRKDTIRFELAKYSPPGVELSANRGVGVLRLAAFHEGTPADVETSLRTLETGVPELAQLSDRGRLVLDLRGVAGGVEAVAYRVADLFAAGELGTLSGRAGELELFNGDAPPVWQGRLVVLIDRGTQGPAEILATVLKQSADATLVGERSFGHSGRLAMVDLTSGGQVQITDAFYTGPDKEPINSSLQPDLWVRPEFRFEADEEPEKDEILERGLDVVLEDEDVEERQAA